MNYIHKIESRSFLKKKSKNEPYNFFINMEKEKEDKSVGFDKVEKEKTFKIII